MTNNLTAYDRIHVRTRTDGKFMWEYLAAGNNETLATDGSQGYEDDIPCRDSAFRVCGVGRTGTGDFSFIDRGRVFDLAEKPRQLSDGSWLYPIRVPGESA